MALRNRKEILAAIDKLSTSGMTLGEAFAEVISQELLEVNKRMDSLEKAKEASPSP